MAKRILIGCFILFSILGRAQLYTYDVDSLKQELLKEKDLLKRGKIFLKLGYSYYLSDNDSAIFNFEQAYQFGKLSGDLFLLAESSARLAQALLYTDPGLATKYVLESVQYSEELKDPSQIAYAQSVLGTIYRTNGEIDKAMEAYVYMNEVAEAAQDTMEIARSFNNIGICHMMNGDYEIGLEYWKKALDLKLEMGREESAAATMANIALYYKDIGRYFEAKEYLDQALEINIRHNDFESVGFNYTILGEMYFKMGNNHESVKYYEKALMFIDSSRSNFNKEAALLGISTTLESLGNYKDALEYYKQCTELLMDQYNEDNARITKELTTKYETDKKEQENLLLKTENDAKDARIQEEQAKSELQKTRNLYLVIGLSVVMMTLIFIVFILRRVRQAKVEIETQKHLLEEKNNEILDSISYAKRLQEAILPTNETIDGAFKNNFVLYMPKDIVAGDFYWMQRTADKILIAAADCTGHGVPGAMVSVVCHNALNRAVREFGISNPGEILDKVTDLVIETFEQGNEEVKDGMDICLCSFDLVTNKVEYAGANNSLYHISDSELFEIKATKQPVGKYSERKNFETNTLQCKEGDSIYLFTDGFADQFGGDKGKKMKYKAFKQILLTNHKKGMIAQRELMQDAFYKWKGELEQIDDVCVIGIRL
ncbi:MAG: tetratricopeptide repeat protein [Crocinitomicaceae bacterium]|nr:tetratricopeptide repeat protein [Crocinitomicaceae bacterium]